MRRISVVSFVAGLVSSILANVPFASAQVSSTGEIAGVVQDQSGAVVAGAKLDLVYEATRTAVRTVETGPNGGFSIPSLSPGNYRVTVTKQGFETAVYTGVTVNAGRTSDLTVTLKLGEVNQTVEVAGAAPVLETTTTQLSTTVQTNELQALPLGLRDVMPFALLVTGAARGNDDRDSTFDGLPGAAVSNTVNGITNTFQRWKSAGTSFFPVTEPRLESVDEVGVATANLGSSTAGLGAMTIQFVQKRGTNAYHGEAFWMTQNNGLNANDWFNNALGIRRQQFILNDFGGNFGGPIIKDKLFLFMSYGQQNQVGGNPRGRSGNENQVTVLNKDAEQGIFDYVGTDGVRHSANLLQLAGAQGFPSAIDPIIGGQLQKVDSTLQFGALNTVDPRVNRLTFLAPQNFRNNYPTVRIDYDPTTNIRVNIFDIFSRLKIGDLDLPLLPGPDYSGYGHISNKYVAGVGLTWVVNPRMTNEFKFGIQSNQETFATGSDVTKFLPRRLFFPSLGPSQPVQFYTSHLESGADDTRGLVPRNNPIKTLSEVLSEQHGNHLMQFGGDWIRASNHESSYGNAGIPNFYFGVVGGDPAGSIFSPANLPNVSANDLGVAFSLYALLTGRVSGISTSRNLDEKTKQYLDLRPFVVRDLRTSYGFYAQDSWRTRPSLTLNYGLRWDVQGDIRNTNGVAVSPTVADFFGPSGAGPRGAANLFNPGSLPGIQNPQLNQRSKMYDTTYGNFAPHLGIAWNPSFQEGLRGRLFGVQKTVFRGGYSINYFSEGSNNIQFFAETGNPGTTQSEFLRPGQAGFAPGSLFVSSPVPPLNVFPASFNFPQPMSNFTFSNGFFTADPHLKAPYVQNWSVGIERQLTGSSVLEIRYVGNRGVHLWRRYSLNEINIFENGFLKEFSNAQNNLKVNQANGVSSFANLGFTGDVALPIFQAAFGAMGSQPALGSAAGFGNSGFINMLQTGQAGALASSLAGSSEFLCRMLGNTFSPCTNLGFDAAGGFPINFFELNPFAAGQTLEYTTSNADSSYNSMQVEFRHKFSNGLSFNANYVLSHSITDRYTKSEDSFANFHSLHNPSLDRGAPFPWDRRHVFQFFGQYDLPVGRGKRFAVNNGLLDLIAGGWNFAWIARIQSGLPFSLGSGYQTVNGEDAGIVLAPGVTTAKLQSQVSDTFPKTSADVFAFNTSLLGPDGRISSQFAGPPTTPGQFGSFIYLHGPVIRFTDLALGKRIPIREKLTMEFQAEFLNAFNHPEFEVLGNHGFDVSNVNTQSTDFGKITQTVTDPRNIQFRVRLFF